MSTERYYYSGTEYGSAGAVLVHDGDVVRPLAHHVRHSPDGFSWGYGGSGPADLARCLLIDALGDQLNCAKCDGTGTIVYVDDEAMSVARAEAEYEVGDPTSMWDPCAAYTCSECDEGIDLEPAMYQQFKFDVVAKWPVSKPWFIGRQQILEWATAYATTREGVSR